MSGRYTLKRLRNERPEVLAEILRLRTQGMSLRLIAIRLNVY